MLYKITLVGCDDRTVVKMELSLEHYFVLKDLQDKVNEESYYACMPKMNIEVIQ